MRMSRHIRICNEIQDGFSKISRSTDLEVFRVILKDAVKIKCTTLMIPIHQGRARCKNTSCQAKVGIQESINSLYTMLKVWKKNVSR